MDMRGILFCRSSVYNTYLTVMMELDYGDDRWKNPVVACYVP